MLNWAIMNMILKHKTYDDVEVKKDPEPQMKIEPVEIIGKSVERIPKISKINWYGTNWEEVENNSRD